MKFKRFRHHKINTGQGTYESMDVGGSVEWDTAVDGEDDDENIIASLGETLDAMLDPEIERVVGLPGIIKESHVFDYYEKD